MMGLAQTAIDFEQQILECAEVCRSFLYFVINWVWIEDKESGLAIRFSLWDSQKRILPVFLSSMLLIILKARQLGLTWLCAAYSVWLCITKPMQLIVVISAKEEWAIEFLERVKFIRNRLPVWMVPPVDKDGGQHVSFVHEYGSAGKPLIISEIKSLATTVEGAQSKTPTLLILDETARNRYIRQIWAASKPGIDAAKGRIIVISNSIKDGVGWSWTRGMYSASMRGNNTFQRIFMPWWDRPDRMTPSEAKAFSRSGGIPVDFKRRQIADGMDPEDFSQHYPESEEEAISAMAGSYFGIVLKRHKEFPSGVIGGIVKSNRGDYEFKADDGGIIEFWRFPYHLVAGFDGTHWTNRYAIGSDVSEGLGRSYSVAYVIDRLTSELVARMRSNRVDAHIWGSMLYSLSMFYGNALICVELTGAGQTTVKRLKELGANQYVKLKVEKLGSEITRQIGWNETEQGKHELSGDLKKWLKTGTVYCPVLIDECATWIKHEGSRRLGPEDGKLGDCVIAGGLTIEASLFLEGPPQKIEQEQTGWLPKWQQGGKSAWAA